MLSRAIRRRAVPSHQLDGALHPVLARVYAARGVGSVGDLKLDLAGLLPVGSLGGVEAAAKLLAAHATGRVLVVGDFDADGATASALMVRVLRRFGFAHVDYLVPDRFKLGYGLSPAVVELARARQPSLIVTVDNGVSSLDGVARARELGLDVLITDHHLPGAELPAATVHVNPNLPGSGFASSALAGVGVAFYVLASLARRLGRPSAEVLDYIDLVALGTVADVVPLDRNNRIIVQQGLRRLRAGRAVAGIRALCSVAGRALPDLVASDLGFFVGPRLNAAGRLDDMSIGIECLLTDDEEQAAALAATLDGLNRERREIEAKMQAEARAIVTDLKFFEPGAVLPYGVCLYDPGWHPGVVGLVASRVKEQVHRPVVAFAPGEDGTARGSARSVPGIHVRDVLAAIATRQPGLLQKFGGHAMAAGLTLATERLAEFAKLFAAEVERLATPELVSGALLTDGTLAPGEFGLETATALREGGPWGSGFAEPSFDGRFTVLEARAVGVQHLKLVLRAARAAPPVDAIAFGWLGDARRRPPAAGSEVELVYRLEVNDYQGVRRVQLLVDHLVPVPAGAAGAGEVAGARVLS